LAEEVKAKIPGIRTEGLIGGIEYFVDGKLQDARFTLGYAQQAAQHGARILTHCRVVSVTASGESSPQVMIQDALTGDTFEFAAALVLNATGAWIDELRHITGMDNKLIEPSKGIHLIVDYIADSPLIMSSSVKGRVFFVIPIDAERTLVGTTDTAVSAAPDDVSADSKDVMDLLHQLFYFFPYFKQGANLLQAIENYKRVHVRDVYWGIRPLLAHGGATLRASREHRLVRDLPRFWSLPGVKLTACRAAGYETAVQAWAFLRMKAPLPDVTWDSLPGGELWDLERFVADAQKRFKLGSNSEGIIRYLISMYGTRYVEVLQWAQRETHFSGRLLPEEPWILAQAAYAAHEEMVLTLNDFLWRRTKWAHYRDLPPDVVKTIAETLGQMLGWSDEECQNQIASYEQELKKHRL
jgi:glycerol-3-phosphate dehydrogenase